MITHWRKNICDKITKKLPEAVSAGDGISEDAYLGCSKAENNEKKRPIMVHRVCYGSIERFIGILTEHFAGKFPTWLAPEQVRVLPIGVEHEEYAKAVREKLESAGIRTEVDARNEKIGYKIRQAQLEKVPYMLVVGEKEAAEGKVAVRNRGGVDLGAVSVDEFLLKALEEVRTLKLD